MTYFRLISKLTMMCIIFLLIGICGCSYTQNSQSNESKDKIDYKRMYEELLREQPPEIEKIEFLTLDGQVLNENNNWIQLEDKVKIRIILNGACTDVKLYIAPTGTETFKLQKAIDIVYPEDGVAEYIWDVPEGTLGHFWVVAYNNELGRKSALINVIREE